MFEGILDRMLKPVVTNVAVSLSEFKRNPAAVLRKANIRPVAVRNRDHVAFYAVDPNLFEAMLEELADQFLYCTAANRLASRSQAVEVSVDEL